MSEPSKKLVQSTEHSALLNLAETKVFLKQLTRIRLKMYKSLMGSGVAQRQAQAVADAFIMSTLMPPVTEE